jgi:hypothetical protein
MIQGQSAVTLDKERRLASMLSISMRIANRKFGGKRWTYFHFDANAGCGWNAEVDVPGSPLVFWTLAEQHLTDMPIVAFFAEHNAALAAYLLRRLPARFADRSFIFKHDNETVLDVFAEYIRRRERAAYAVGSIIVDPNGWFYRSAKGEGAPVDGLRRFAREFPRIDIALNLNARSYRLLLANGQQVEPPRAIMRALKAHWLVGRTQHGGNEYLLAFGRNMAAGGHAAVGMHRLDSPAGHAIVNRVEGGRQGDFVNAGLWQLPGIPGPSGVSRGSRGGAAQSQLPLPLWGAGDRNPSPPRPLSPVGNVRRCD